MRSAVLERREGVLTAIETFTRHNEPLTAAAAYAAAASLIATFDILQGTRTLPVWEPAPALVLTAELLKVPGVHVNAALEQVTLPEDTTVRQLLEAVDRSWDEALLAQVDAENFEAARFLLKIAADEQAPSVEGRPVTLTVGNRPQGSIRPRGGCGPSWTLNGACSPPHCGTRGSITSSPTSRMAS